ncbi:hypothetical protein AB5N10_01905 [Weissella paramesenteroides]|uniref:hypothetical protein n=1 Tax=Weissella paramesenteroides TaxID=1249 RepID=UPI0011271E3B|nr:hypothetical protein [Weissella paramesenteroides]MBU7556890.1 hypothetical protein [Weissella paramesenteroides]TPF01579.1 hypothetical protein DIS13_07250 [Weissella paramesenteroides]
MVFLGLEVGSWAEWISGVLAALAIFFGLLSTKFEKQIRLKLKGIMLYQYGCVSIMDETIGGMLPKDINDTYLKINLTNIGLVDIDIKECGISNSKFTLENRWNDCKKSYALYFNYVNLHIPSKSALSINKEEFPIEYLGSIAKDKHRRLLVYVVDQQDNIYFGKLKTTVRDLSDKTSA